MSHVPQGIRVLAIVLAAVTPLGAQSGAVYTTDQDGNTVNGNRYSQTTDVFLRAASASPDGEYVFQVTNSSGARLLSTDAITARTVTVAGGIIVDAGDHSLGSEIKKGGGGSANVVQLAPFDTLDGGQYKVWLMPKSALVAGGYHGFVPSASKTDNFKVEKGKPAATTTITGVKYYDADQDATRDDGERGLAGWRIELRKKGSTDLLAVSFTNENGEYVFPGLPQDGTEYEVTEVAPIFKDPDAGTVLSDQGFIGQASGARWLAITPRTGIAPPANTEFVKGPDFGNVYFVPADTSSTGDKPVYSKGFWHSDNGKALLKKCVHFPSVLNTYTYEGKTSDVSLSRAEPLNGNWIIKFEANDFDKDFAAMSDWITSPAYGTAAYQLSREVAAALMNRYCGNMTGNIYINETLGGADLVGLMSFEEVVWNTLKLLNDPKAWDTGPQATDPDSIALREAMYFALDGRSDSMATLARFVSCRPSRGKQFSQINTASDDTGEVVIVWEPEEDSTAVPQPIELYGDLIYI